MIISDNIRGNKMILDRIKIRKLIQSAGYLLSLTKNKKMNYTKLLKLLYISDKESLKKWDKTITGDIRKIGSGSLLFTFT